MSASLHVHLPTDVLHVQDCIVTYRGLDKELCTSVIDLFDRDENKSRGKVGKPGDLVHQEEIKRSWDLEIRNEGPWRDLFQQIHPPIDACMTHYLAGSPVLQSLHLQVTGYKLQKYPQHTGHFRWHADSTGKSVRDRVAAMVLYLNDVQKGGETEFYYQKLKITPQAGNLVLFPTGWNYMHCGHTPESGDKYIISAFIRIKD